MMINSFSPIPGTIPVGVSNRHVHLSSHDRAILFGPNHRLTYLKSLSQKGQFVASEMVTLVGAKGSIGEVRVLGPERKATQVEISRTDMYRLGIHAPVRDSGEVDGTPGLILIGPKGLLQLKMGVMCAKRHIHMSPEDAAAYNLRDKDEVWVRAGEERRIVFGCVLIRVHESFTLEFHIDTDEANAACLNNNDRVEIFYPGT